MKMVFSIIFALLIIFYFLREFYRNRTLLGERKKIMLLVFRSLTLVFCLLAFFSFSFTWKAQGDATIFLVDESLSAESYSRDIEILINAYLEEKNKKEEVAILSFAKDVFVEYPFQRNLKNISLSSSQNKNFTNIENALNFSKDYFPRRSQKKLVIFTDGYENLGDVSSLEKKLDQESINLFIYPIEREFKKDIQISDLDVVKLDANNYRVKAILDSNFSGNGLFILKANTEKILEENISFLEGENTVIKNVLFDDSSLLDLSATIDSSEDLITKNNTLKRSIDNLEKDKLLLIGDVPDIENIKNIISNEGMEVDVSRAVDVGSTVSFLSNYQEVILANTAVEELPKDFSRNLENVVKNQGIGLFLVAGEKTFALGNYESSLLEKILPVESKMKDNQKHPSTGLVLAIDCSGSMEEKSGGMKKIDIAKEAAKKSIDVLDDGDYVGVLAFSDRLEWVVPLQEVKNKDKIKKEINNLSSQGGTLILPAIKESFKELDSLDIKVKHTILMTDGHGEKDGFEDIINKFNEKAISLTTVGVGEDTDELLLKKISENTQGRNYLVKDAHNLTKIFAQETYLATKKYLNDEEFIPILTSNHEVLDGFSFPSLLGYMGSGIKEGANLLLKSNKDDPILSYWQYGLGKVYVWNSDLNGSWSRNYLNWTSFPSFINNIVRDSLAPKSQDFALELEQKKNIVDLKFRKNADIDELELILNAPDSSKRNIEYEILKKDIYGAKIYLDEVGEYSLNILEKKDGKVVNRKNKTLQLTYSPEYDLTNKNIFNSLGKNFVFTKDDLLSLKIKKENIIKKDFKNAFLILALFSFCIDVALRKNY